MLHYASRGVRVNALTSDCVTKERRAMTPGLKFAPMLISTSTVTPT